MRGRVPRPGRGACETPVFLEALASGQTAQRIFFQQPVRKWLNICTGHNLRISTVCGGPVAPGPACGRRGPGGRRDRHCHDPGDPGGGGSGGYATRPMLPARARARALASSLPPSQRNTHNTLFIIIFDCKRHKLVCANCTLPRGGPRSLDGRLMTRRKRRSAPGAAVPGRAPICAAGPLPPHQHCLSFLDCAAPPSVSAPSALSMAPTTQGQRRAAVQRHAFSAHMHTLVARPSALEVHTTQGRQSINTAYPRDSARKARETQQETEGT